MSDASNPFGRILLVKHHRRPSSRVLAGAVALAESCRARLTFAHALEGGDRIDELAQRQRLSELESLLAPHLEGVDADYRLFDGDLSAAAEQAGGDYDLLIPAEGEPGSEAAGREMVGLLRSAPLPVWLAADRGLAPRGILAAVDVQTSNPLKQALNLPILRRALALASRFDARLDVLAVWTTPPISERVARRLKAPAEPRRPWRDYVRTRLEALLDEALAGAPSPAREPRLLIARGDADALIAQAAESSSVDLLVAGCLGRSGLEAWLVGDTAARLSHKLSCSILAVKLDPKQIDQLEARERTRAA